METTKVTVQEAITEGVQIGIKNAISLLGAVVLWILTIWIPYLNVGTTIAISTIPIALSKGKVISPLFIFDGKYRQFMGEYFTLLGLKMMSIIPATIFMIIPGYIIALGWKLALYILLDKGVAPGEALVQSNKATYGYKWTIFFTSLLLGIAFIIIQTIIMLVFSKIPFLLFIMCIALIALYQITYLGCMTVFYKKLVLGHQD